MPSSSTRAPARLEARHHGVQIRPDVAELETAERVVGAQLEEDDLGAELERPVHPAEPARGGVAGHPRVDHLIAVSLAAQAGGEERGIRFVRGDTVPGGEAVAEGNDDALALGARRRDETEDDERRRHAMPSDLDDAAARAGSSHIASVV